MLVARQRRHDICFAGINTARAYEMLDKHFASNGLQAQVLDYVIAGGGNYVCARTNFEGYREIPCRRKRNYINGSWRITSMGREFHPRELTRDFALKNRLCCREWAASILLWAEGWLMPGPSAFLFCMAGNWFREFAQVGRTSVSYSGQNSPHGSLRVEIFIRAEIVRCTTIFTNTLFAL